MREINLNTSSAGMTRLRVKGGASPESLYELYNGFINASKIPQQRPAAPYKFSVPPASKGLVLHKGIFYTFSSAPLAAVTGSTNQVLLHPTAGYVGSITKIHFAQPFMAKLYVVAEFAADAAHNVPVIIAHYWLQEPKVWQAVGIYKTNELVSPSTPNGLYYRATIKDPPAAWRPESAYSQGDYVQPTTYNGWKYVALFCYPQSPTVSSDVEPIWPTVEEATVFESSSGNQQADPAPPAPPTTVPTGLEQDGRYTNIGGSGGRGQFGNTPIRVR